jgi:hypothetical protein
VLIIIYQFKVRVKSLLFIVNLVCCVFPSQREERERARDLQCNDMIAYVDGIILIIDYCSSISNGNGTSCSTMNISGTITTSCCGLNRLPANINPLCMFFLPLIHLICIITHVIDSCVVIGGKCLDGYSEWCSALLSCLFPSPLPTNLALLNLPIYPVTNVCI